MVSYNKTKHNNQGASDSILFVCKKFKKVLDNILTYILCYVIITTTKGKEGK